MTQSGAARSRESTSSVATTPVGAAGADQVGHVPAHLLRAVGVAAHQLEVRMVEHRRYRLSSHVARRPLHDAIPHRLSPPIDGPIDPP